MYIQNGIVYAGDPTPILEVVAARKKDNHTLIVAFNNGTVREVDCTSLFTGVFAPLKNEEAFSAFSVLFGTVVWQNGELDIAPEWLYDHGVTVDEQIAG